MPGHQRHGRGNEYGHGAKHNNEYGYGARQHKWSGGGPMGAGNGGDPELGPQLRRSEHAEAQVPTKCGRDALQADRTQDMLQAEEMGIGPPKISGKPMIPWLPVNHMRFVMCIVACYVISTSVERLYPVACTLAYVFLAMVSAYPLAAT